MLPFPSLFEQFDSNLLLGCVLYSLPTDNKIQDLAERYGWCPNDERRLVVDSLIP